MAIVLANKQPIELGEARRFTVLIHQPGIKVEVPDFFEINCRMTVKCMEEMSQRAWNHIRTGPLFQTLWEMAYPSNEGEPLALPDEVTEFPNTDMELLHVGGLIVLMVEKAFELIDGKISEMKIFLVQPETYCHPKTQRHLMSLIKALCLLLGINSDDAGGKDGKEIGKMMSDFDRRMIAEAQERALKRMGRDSEVPPEPEEQPTCPPEPSSEEKPKKPKSSKSKKKKSPSKKPSSDSDESSSIPTD